MKKRKNSSDSAAMVKKAGLVGQKAPAVAKESAAAAAASAEPPPPQPPPVEAEARGAMGEWVGEEQMWWEGQWFPSWDVQVMGEAYISSLYSDVWDGYDDDIWGFRNSDVRLPTARPTP